MKAFYLDWTKTMAHYIYIYTHTPIYIYMPKMCIIVLSWPNKKRSHFNLFFLPKIDSLHSRAVPTIGNSTLMICYRLTSAEHFLYIFLKLVIVCKTLDSTDWLDIWYTSPTHWVGHGWQRLQTGMWSGLWQGSDSVNLGPYACQHQ